MSELTPLIHSHLIAQLGQDPAVDALASWISEQALAWTPPVVALAEIDLILAYAFGNRPQADDPAAESWGGMVGGPVNSALADAVAQLHAQRPVRIYAQWEIADDLVRRHGLSDVISIRLVTGPDGLRSISAPTAWLATSSAGRTGPWAGSPSSRTEIMPGAVWRCPAPPDWMPGSPRVRTCRLPMIPGPVRTGPAAARPICCMTSWPG